MNGALLLSYLRLKYLHLGIVNTVLCSLLQKKVFLNPFFNTFTVLMLTNSLNIYTNKDLRYQALKCCSKPLRHGWKLLILLQCITTYKEETNFLTTVHAQNRKFSRLFLMINLNTHCYLNDL